MARTPKKKSDKKTASAAEELIPETREVSVILMPMINNGTLPEILTAADTYVEPGDFDRALTQGRATIYYEVPRRNIDMFDSGPLRPENATDYFDLNPLATRINRRTVNIGNCTICHRAGPIGLQCLECANIDVTHYRQLVTTDPDDQSMVTVQPIALATAIGHEYNIYSWGSIEELEQYFYTSMESEEKKAEPEAKKRKYDDTKRIKSTLSSSSDDTEGEEKERKAGKTEEEDTGPYVNWDAVLLDEHDKHLIKVKACEYGLSKHISCTRKQIRKIEKIKAKIAESKKEAKGRK